MQEYKITLDFGTFEITANVFDNEIARKFVTTLPVTVQLQQWGDEVFGSIGEDLGTENHPQRAGICTLLSIRRRMALFYDQLHFAADDCRKNTTDGYFQCA